MATTKRNVIVEYQEQGGDVDTFTISYVNPTLTAASVYSAVHDIFDYTTNTVTTIYLQDTYEISGGE